MAVGDDVELAPRDPDPTATYDWRVAAAPADSTAAVGERPVEHLVPDVPGLYRVELTAPDGTHTQTIRAFPGRLAESAAEGGDGGVYGPSANPETTDLARAPGGEGASGGAGSGQADDESLSTDADGGGRPRVSLTADRAEDPADETDDVANGNADALVVRAQPQPHPEGSETVDDLGVEFLVDDRDDVDGADVTVEGRELRLPTEAISDRVRVYAVSVGRDGYSVPDAIEVATAERGEDGEDGLREFEVSHPYTPPDGVEDDVIYEIYVRTFPGQDPDHEYGPDGERSVFDAIVDRLDYIADLGVDTLWLTPVLQHDGAPHGYNVTDFFAIAEDLGTRADYERFVEAAHERGLSVLFDLVCNHSARDHPHFQAAVSDPDSEYREWYEWRTATEPETYFEWQYIANFDFDHLPVRRHLLDAVDAWAPLVDGFRCDMAWAVPEGFWREVHDRCKARDDEFLLLDETIPYVPDFQAGLFDVHFDSTTYAALRRVGRGDAPATDVLEAVRERTRIGFPDHAGFMLYAENHDEARYLVECGRPASRAALGALFTLPGAPMVYAGQEFGQRGKRDALAWDHADEDLRRHVERLAATRRNEAALTADADLQQVPVDVRDGDPGRVVAFVRETAEDAALVVLNFGADAARVSVERETGERDLVTGEPVARGDGIAVADVVVVRTDATSSTQ